MPESIQDHKTFNTWYLWNVKEFIMYDYMSPSEKKEFIAPFF